MNTFVRKSWPFVAFAAILAVFFLPILFRGAVIAPLDLLCGLLRPWADGPCGAGVHNQCTVDAIRQHIPYDWAVFDSLRHDGFVGWDPCSYGGRALLENTMLCPGDWHHLLYLALPFWSAWNLGILFQFFIAGAGVLALVRAEARARGASFPTVPALLAATAFAFYSQNVAWLHHRFVLGCACFLPWLAWSLRRAVRAGRSFSLPAVLFAALAFRGGTLQTCLYPVLLGTGLFAADALALRRANAGERRRTALRLLALYASAALGGALLSADVLARTIPACLAGARELHRWTWAEMLLSLPTLASSFVPTLCGTPQSLDVFRLFHQHPFFVRYAGGVPLCLALAAFVRRDAPLAPRILFAGSLALHFTPLNTWLYNRSTVVFALGLAWLAAWELAHLRDRGRRPWTVLLAAFLACVAVWVAAGLAAMVLDATLSSKLHTVVARALPPEKAFRLPWIETRADRFLGLLRPWNPVNLAFLVPLGAGLLLCRRLASPAPLPPRRETAAHAGVLACACAELFVFSRLWLTFCPAPQPSEAGPFADPDWTRALREETRGAGYVWIHSAVPDEDFFTLNVHSGFGLRFLSGSDTIAPIPRLPPPDDPGAFDPAGFARAGVSHVVANPRFPVPEPLAAWTRLPLAEDRFLLFRNPAFESLAHAVLADGSRVPVPVASEGRNRVRLELPPGTVAVEWLSNYHPGWRASLDGTPARVLPGDPGTRVRLPSPSTVPSTLRLDFQASPPFPTIAP